MENNEKNNSVKTEQQIKRNNNPRKKRIVKKTKENKAEAILLKSKSFSFGFLNSLSTFLAAAAKAPLSNSTPSF